MKNNRFGRLALVVISLAATFAPLVWAAPEWPPKTLPIMTWLGPGKDLLTAEIFKKIADAGFSINMSFLGDKASNLKALDLARQVNAEIRAIEKLVLRWTSEAVYHSEPLPEGTLALPSDAPVRAVRNAPAVIGLFKDGADSFVMFVHRDYENDGLAVVEFDQEIHSLIEIAKDQTPPAVIRWPEDAPAKTAALFLRPGDARIFKIVRQGMSLWLVTTGEYGGN